LVDYEKFALCPRGYGKEKQTTPKWLEDSFWFSESKWFGGL